MNIHLIGVPTDFGAGRRGVDMGPSAIRYAGLAAALERLGHTVHDRGNIHVSVVDDSERENPQLHHLNEILQLTAPLADLVANALDEGSFPLTIGGDHSL